MLLLIELGALRLAQRISGLPLEDFIELLRRAGVWIPLALLHIAEQMPRPSSRHIFRNRDDYKHEETQM